MNSKKALIILTKNPELGKVKTRLAKFKGMHKQTFYLHLRECEFRYNYRNQNIYKTLLFLLKEKTLNLS